MRGDVSPVNPISQAFRDNLKRNQFGGTVGGPIKKDRLFFFVGWQDTIQRSTNPATTTLPTAAMLAGTSPCLGNGSRNAWQYDRPRSALRDRWRRPQPNQSCEVQPHHLRAGEHIFRSRRVAHSDAGPCGTYGYQTPANFTENQGLARIDFQQSGKNTIFGRYFITNWNQPPGNPNLPPAKGGLLIAAIDGQADRVQNLTLGDTYLISLEHREQHPCDRKSKRTT